MTPAESISDIPTSTVLIVDDDRTARLVLRELLQSQGLDVVEAEDGEAGLARFHECEPDLVLMDLDMPGMDGLVACQEIRSLPEKADLPIIMVSGHQEAHAINAAYAAGVSDFVVKPVNPSLLANRVRFLLASRQPPAVGRQGPGAAQLLETLPDRVIVFDRKGKVLEQAGSPDGREEAAVVGVALSALWPADIHTELQRLINKALKTRKPATWKFQHNDADARRHYEARAVPQGINRVMMIVRDITAETITESRIEALGFYDALTGLPNRFFFLKKFDEHLTDARFRQRRLALVLLDITDLERRRETLGRSMVDSLLVDASKRLLGSTRTGGRGAGDEGEVALLGDQQFGVLLQNVADATAADKASERLAALLREPLEVKGQEIQLEVRVGVALYPDHGGDIETLLQIAEQGVMEYGLPGDDEENISTGVRRRLASLRDDLFDEVRWGFEQDQFELHYLPKLDIRLGVVTGVEALLRWQHPLRGQVPLSEFFPVIQDSGLIIPVGDWVLRTACAQLVNWRRELNPDLVMAVNCAAQQFVLPDFVERVRGAIDDTGVERGAVELELTEAMLMREPDLVRRKLGRLKKTGLGLVLDDFGTGFTSLQNFSDMPLDALKIDRTFVRQIPEQPGAVAICGAIVDIAHRFGALAVAEGVESDRQAELLTGMGCDQIQGFLLTRPLPADEMGEFLKRGEQVASRIAATPGPRPAGV